MNPIETKVRRPMSQLIIGDIFNFISRKDKYSFTGFVNGCYHYKNDVYGNLFTSRNTVVEIIISVSNDQLQMF